MTEKSDRNVEKKGTEERRDAGITRMLSTPPKPFTKKKNSNEEGSGQRLRSDRPSKPKIKSGD